MLTTHNYAIAWGLYLFCALGFYLLFWPVLSRIRWTVPRRFLRALLAVLLFTPVMTVPAEKLMAPATLVLVFEASQGDIEAAVQAGMLLVLALLAVLGMLLLEALFRRLLQPSVNDD